MLRCYGLLFLSLVAGCQAEMMMPCKDASGTCLVLQLKGEVGPVDRVRLDLRSSMRQTHIWTSPSGAAALPLSIEIGVTLDLSASAILRAEAQRAGKTVGLGSTMVTRAVASGGQVEITLMAVGGATCEDKFPDGRESDIDCGGDKCPLCEPGRYCDTDADCESHNCEGGVCAAPSCTDLRKNGTETDLDCGGTCPVCRVGQRCNLPSECNSSVCQRGRCVDASCSDGVKNKGEIDVDCGGECGKCLEDQYCATKDDCETNLCVRNTCQIQPVLTTISPTLGSSAGGYPLVLAGTFKFKSGEPAPQLFIDNVAATGVVVKSATRLEAIAPASLNTGFTRRDVKLKDRFNLEASLLKSFTYFASVVDFGTPLLSMLPVNPHSLAMADLDGDTRPDLLVGTDVGTKMGVLRGDGTGFFPMAEQLTVGSKPRIVFAADFSGDGKPDIGALNYDTDDVSVLINNGDGTFKAAVNTGAGAKPIAFAVGLFNNDARLDLAVANRDAAQVTVLLGKGNGEFEMPTTFASAMKPFWMVSADFNKDMKADLAVVSNQNDTVMVHLGAGDGTFGMGESFDLKGGTGPQGMVVGDFDRDTRPDLAVGNLDTHDVSVLIGKGDGKFNDAVNYSVGGMGPEFLAIGDVNGDGLQDLVSANSGSMDMSVLIGRANGTFDTAKVFLLPCAPHAVRLSDVDSDTRPDLVGICHDSTARVLLSKAR